MSISPSFHVTDKDADSSSTFFVALKSLYWDAFGEYTVNSVSNLTIPENKTKRLEHYRRYSTIDIIMAWMSVMIDMVDPFCCKAIVSMIVITL